MSKLMIALVGVLVLAGCQAGAPTKPEAPQASTKPQAAAAPVAASQELSAEASQALAKAEADVKAAQEKKALWTTAQDALKQAKAAAKENDSAAVIKHSKVASEQANLGIAQTQYPVTGIAK